MTSKRRLRRNACTGKVRYESEDDAYDALRRVQQKRAATPGLMNVYRCAFHTSRTPRHWHLGHSSG